MYLKHKLSALIEVDPKAAKALIVEAYTRAKASQVDAAKLLGVAKSTLVRYVARLEMSSTLDALRRKAQREGWFHDKLTHGGRPRKKVA